MDTPYLALVSYTTDQTFYHLLVGRGLRGSTDHAGAADELGCSCLRRRIRT